MSESAPWRRWRGWAADTAEACGGSLWRPLCFCFPAQKAANHPALDILQASAKKMLTQLESAGDNTWLCFF
jgi:hypothetical protein